MNLSEFRNKVNESNNFELLNNLEFKFDYYYINQNQTINGITSLYTYLDNQLKGWHNINSSKKADLKDVSMNYFKVIFEYINNVDFTANGFNINQYKNSTTDFIGRTSNYPLPFDCPETIFFVDLIENYPQSYSSAFNFLIKKSNYNLNNNDSVIGVILSYEFLLKDKTEITERRDKEKKSLSRLRSDYTRYISENEAIYNDLFKKNKNTIDDHDSKLKELFSNKESELDALKIEKRDDLAKLYADHDLKYQNLITEKNKKFEQLEDTYKEKLKLAEPAEYWKSRAEFLKRQGWMSLGGLVVLVFIGIILLYNLLWNTPQEMLTSYFGKNSNPAHAIRWSIVFVTFISFLAFAIRALYKVTFSSFHLARDSEERHTLTYFYLSLIKDSEVSDSERELIMQSLFSRAETGLLKDEAGPTMPGVGGIASNLMNSK